MSWLGMGLLRPWENIWIPNEPNSLVSATGYECAVFCIISPCGNYMATYSYLYKGSSACIILEKKYGER